MSASHTLWPILAQAAAPASPAGPGSSLMGMLPILFLLGAMYFLMIAPQRKKQKAQDAMLKSLKTGDEIITSSGIFGTITNVKEDRFVVRISDTTKIDLAKGFVQSVVARADGDKPAA